MFAEDGEWIAPHARARGLAEIAALMARNIPAEPRRKHFVLQAAGAGLTPSVAGTYEDVLVRTAAGWRFRERRLVHDLVAGLGLNLPSTRW